MHNSNVRHKYYLATIAPFVQSLRLVSTLYAIHAVNYAIEPAHAAVVTRPRRQVFENGADRLRAALNDLVAGILRCPVSDAVRRPVVFKALLCRELIPGNDDHGNAGAALAVGLLVRNLVAVEDVGGVFVVLSECDGRCATYSSDERLARIEKTITDMASKLDVLLIRLGGQPKAPAKRVVVDMQTQQMVMAATTSIEDAVRMLTTKFPDLTSNELHAGMMHAKGETWELMQSKCKCKSPATLKKRIDRFYEVMGWPRPDRRAGLGKKVALDEGRDGFSEDREDRED